MVLAPPPASPGTVAKAYHLPLDLQEQQEFRIFVDHLKSELHLRDSMGVTSTADSKSEMPGAAATSDVQPTPSKLRSILSLANSIISHPVISGLIVVVVGGFICIGVYTRWGFNLMDPSSSLHGEPQTNSTHSDSHPAASQTRQTVSVPTGNDRNGLLPASPSSTSPASQPSTVPMTTSASGAQTQATDDFEIIRLQRAMALNQNMNRGIPTTSPATRSSDDFQQIIDQRERARSRAATRPNATPD